MKPRKITSLADLEATIEWRKEHLGAKVGWDFFVGCMELEPPVATHAMMRYFNTKNATVVNNWKRHYLELTK